MTNDTNKLLAIVGPTASGKSAWGERLAKKYRGAILSADSRQIYKELSIGTNAPTKQTQRRIPHYFIQTLQPTKAYSVGQFQREATRALRHCWKNRRLPIVVGGTGLYIDALVSGFSFPTKKPEPALRRRLIRLSLSQLFTTLRRLAPKTAATIDQHNRHRLIRTLEIAMATGQEPITLRQRQGKPWDCLLIGVSMDRQTLYHRIDQRVDLMIRRGLIAEVRRLSKKYSWELPAMSGIGYKQIGQYLRGEISRAEAIRLIKRDTRHYAKRQLTWFRRNRQIHWFSHYTQAEKAVRTFLAN
ncbi:MAG: tRNA (adenosine(37)-N6)-dimethylallyltransferase MiaA [Patescibacteria group bacterium]